ncbi:ABC transporter ATP-binding protein/permease [Clostridium sp. 2218st1_F5_2218SCRN_220325]|uniref:ABC transporter ATP-binding protein/permease n=1 Tax=Clostridium sp. 2218st1_F5_2218SCRN_220325 TaxID=3143056 RepID=UPI00319E0D6B
MLQLKNIYKSYITGGSRQIALDGINLKFRESEFVTILGASGSGKTTLLNIIGGLEHFDKGDLIINGKSTKEFTDSNWDSYRNTTVGFIFKNYNLIPHLSILENVKMAVSLSDLSKQEIQEKSIEALNKVGIKDYMKKTSEYLSKDEMQRVAIARALVNDPKIILADEPTGNLDSRCSMEIMDLIKDVFKDKLVIMVTQNPHISQKYANRIITVRDGEVIEDTNSLKDELHQKPIKLNKTKLKISTGIRLAIRDISNKKLRTFFYILISSIGIMGIALIVALIEGFNEKINNYENDSLANYPIVIDKVYNNSYIYKTDSDKQDTENIDDLKSHKDENVIYPYDSDEDDSKHKNQITQKYIQYIKNMDKSLFSAISYESQVNMNILKKDEDGKISILDTSSINLSSYPKDYGDGTYLEQNYDLLYGYYPTNQNEVVLVVDEYNRLDTEILNALGVNYNNNKKIEFDELIGKEYKIILNNEFYKKNNNYFYIDSSEENLDELYNSKKAITISITGILRAKKSNNLYDLPQGISYSNELCNYYIENCIKSDIVKVQENSDYNVITGQKFKNSNVNEGVVTKISGVNILNNINQSVTKNQMLSSLGASFLPSSITIYPKDFESKSDIIEYLDNYNKDKPKDEKVLYKDTSTPINKLSTSIMRAITIVLIVFGSLVFLISLITIFVLTYASTLERKREVSILRVLGSKKRDIIRLFNIENIIIGLLSGVFGVFMAYVFIMPMNFILERIIDLPNIAVLKIENTLILIVISILITLIGGFIPAKIASRKDPVEFLKKV